MDWRDPEATRALTQAILHTRYRLDVLLPRDRLCPAVTGRANYIRFLHAILAEPRSSAAPTDPPSAAAGAGGGDEVWGVDVGTGASCIYALLGARLHGWHFVATDTDRDSLLCAQQNVERNGLGHLVETRLVTEESIVESVVAARRVDFVMCNPPFFDTEDRTGPRSRNPMRACPMTAGERSTPGGETAFVKRLVDESTRAPRQCRWWSSLLGCKRSLRAVWDYLHGGCAALPRELPLTVREGELVQGRTARWVIAWSFCADTKEEAAEASETKEAAEPPVKRARKAHDESSSSRKDTAPAATSD